MKKEKTITIELNQKQIDIIFKMSDECGSFGEYWNENWYTDRDAYRDLIMKTIEYTTKKEFNKVNYDGYIKKWKNYKKGKRNGK